MTVDGIRSELRKISGRINTKQRIQHIERTTEFILSLCSHHGKDPAPASIASAAHDLFRDLSNDRLLALASAFGTECTSYERQYPILLHGKVCALWLRKRYKPWIPAFDKVFEAVYFHSSGFSFSSYVGLFLFIADAAELSRTYNEVDEVRSRAFQDPDRAFCLVIKQKIRYALAKDRFLLPETCHAWNDHCIPRNEEPVDD